MEPFYYRDEAIPHFSLPVWEEEHPHLMVGISA